MLKTIKKIGVIGFGSFTKEIICNIKTPFDIFVTSDYYNKINNNNNNNIESIKQKYNCSLFELNNFDSKKYEALITIVDNKLKTEILNDLPKNTTYYKYIDKRSIIMDNNIKLGEGVIICANSILTTNIVLGNFSQINLNTTIGHDTICGDNFTTAPGVNISGNCIIGKNVYIGTNSSIKENIKITDNVIIGMNTGIIKNIDMSGTYVGTPIIKIK
jgi:sugar O-acyltransferase (sialic acid O-acetyltransferase NeuD family)